MNVLTDTFPQAVEIDGVEYQLNTDFRTGIKIMLAFEDAELTDLEKCAVAVQLLYKDIPPNFERAYQLAVKFLDCGEESQQMGAEETGRLYSFGKDAKYIYSAIKQSHGIDLETVAYLHWWKFVYLLFDINEHCFFQKIISFRAKRAKGKLTKEEREYCNSIAEILELPDVLSSEDDIALDDFYSQLSC